MSAKSLSKDIVDDISSIDPKGYSSGTPVQMNTIIANLMKDYIVKNCRITGLYTGVIPGTPPVPESVTEAWSVTGTILPFISYGSEFNAWLSSIQLNISTGILTGKGTYSSPIVPIPAFPTLIIPLTINDMSDIAKDNSDPKVAYSCWEKIISEVFKSIELLTSVVRSVPSKSVAGGTGTFVPSSIKIL